MRAHVVGTLLLIGCGLALAACGSSSGSGQTSGSKPSAGIAFADCMRSHGVPNFPDPGGAGGVQIPVGSGINPASPSFQAARTRCAKLLPGAGEPFDGHATAATKAAMLATSMCMRAHGVSGFPDPTVTPPGNIAAYSIAMGRGGVFLAVPRTINISSPVFQRAASACRFGGRGGGHAAPAPSG